MTTEPENLVLTLLRELRSEMREGFEDLHARLAEVKEEVLACRKDVAGADLASKQVAVRLTLLEKRVKELEEARVN